MRVLQSATAAMQQPISYIFRALNPWVPPVDFANASAVTGPGFGSNGSRGLLRRAIYAGPRPRHHLLLKEIGRSRTSIWTRSSATPDAGGVLSCLHGLHRQGCGEPVIRETGHDLCSRGSRRWAGVGLGIY